MISRPLSRLAWAYRAQARDLEWLSVRNILWLLAAFTVGFFVRVNGLAAQSLWNDEGTSVALAQTNVGAILSAASQDIHPPLYYILLSGWIKAAGISEFSIRFLSVIAGVLVIAVTFRIAREFFKQNIAVMAAVLSALNPFQVYYAQETRMYIWVTLFAALSLWAMVVMLKPPKAHLPLPSQFSLRRLVFFFLYILFTLAALYTNYYAFTLVIIENLVFLAWLVRTIRARLPRPGTYLVFWVAGQVVIALAYVPWLAFARKSLTNWPGISEPMTLWDMGVRILSAFVTGADTARDFQILLVGAYLVLFVGGLFPARDLLRQSTWGIVTCALWAIVPFLAMYFVSLTRPAYNPKFLLLATPGFLILAARGLAIVYPGLFMSERAPASAPPANPGNRITRQVVAVGKSGIGFLFAAGTVLALQSTYTDPRLQRDDYRGIVRYLNAVATDRDAVIVNAPGQLDVVRYYYASPARLVGLPVGRPAQREATESTLDELSTRENIYGIFWATDQSDPDKIVERRLAQTSFKASDEWHGAVRLTQYASPQQADWQSHSVDARFGGQILLKRYTFPAAAQEIDRTVPLELEWHSLGMPPTARYKVFAQLLDEQGRLVSQRDAEPRDGYFSTDQWTADETVIDKIAIPVPAGTPPGTYRVIVGLYNGDTGERLPVTSTARPEGSDFVVLGEIHLAKKIVPRDALLIPFALNSNFGAIALIGYQLAQRTYARGEFIPLVLYFQANEKPLNDTGMQVQMWDQGSNVVASTTAFATYPTSQWDTRESVRDNEMLAIPQDALPGEYKIVVTNGAQSVQVTRIQVR